MDPPPTLTRFELFRVFRECMLPMFKLRIFSLFDDCVTVSFFGDWIGSKAVTASFMTHTSSQKLIISTHYDELPALFVDDVGFCFNATTQSKYFTKPFWFLRSGPAQMFLF